MKLVSLILFCLVSPSYSQPRDSVVTRLIQYVVKRVRENDPYPRMPDYIPPVVDDLRTDEHGNCLSDQIPCWDGTNASRNAELDCEFNQCPPRKYCHNDVKKCPDGSYMIRNPWRDCFFHACPEVADCTPDKYRCWDGSYVSRNPRDECHFLPCPPMKVRSAIELY